MLVGSMIPGEHQIAEHFITTSGGVEVKHLVSAAQGFPQRSRLGGHDLQRIAVNTGGVQPQIQGALTLGQPLARGGLQRLNLAIIVR